MEKRKKEGHSCQRIANPTTSVLRLTRTNTANIATTNTTASTTTTSPTTTTTTMILV